MSTKRKILPFLEARKLARSLGLKGLNAWEKYHKKYNPPTLPYRPSYTYRNDGWVNWMDWLGTNNIRGQIRRHKVNDDYFKKWSHNMAYIFGFWLTDGYIGKYNSYIFSISQHKDDKYLLEAILKEMESNYLLYRHKNTNNYDLNIRSKIIYDDIIKLGGKERKSLDVKFPKIPKKYLPDFIRGLWDGDGSIVRDKNRKQLYNSNYVSGSKELALGLYRILKKNIPYLKGSFVSKKNEYRVIFSKNDSIRLKNFMYQEPLDGKLMLKRKYELFLKNPNYCTDEFWDYNRAKMIVRLMGIKSIEEWCKYCKDGKIPHNIPRWPDCYYKNSGWVDWYAWLGKSKRIKTTSPA
jgi:hypothetical protein